MKKLLLPICVLCCFTLLSCNTKKTNTTIETKSTPDTLQLSVTMNTDDVCNFNFVGDFYFDHHIPVESDSILPSVRKNHYPLKYKNQIFEYSWMQLKPFQFENHYFFVNDKANKLEFTFNGGNLSWPKESGMVVLDDIYESYLPIRKQLNLGSYSSKQSLIRQIDSIYISNKNKFKNEHIKLQVNHLHYIDKLQKIDSYSPIVIDFIVNMKDEPIACKITADIFKTYIKYHIDNINYQELESRYSPVFIDLFTKAMYHYLRDPENKGDSQNGKGLNWFKQTNYYQKHKKTFEPEITPLDFTEFKNKITNVSLLDQNQNILMMEDIVKNNPADFYLIDFWATWCGPCKSGIKKIETLPIPNNVKVINLSLDKVQNIEKWKRFVKESGQKLSYLINKKDLNNKDFIKYIRVQSIPRYLIIDKHMNLVDEEFYRPHEPKFITDLMKISAGSGEAVNEEL